MSEQEKDKKLPDNTKLHNGQDENGYRFMDQTIKKRPVDRKLILMRIFGIIAAGVVIGLIASFVFTLTQPSLRSYVSEGKTTDKVTIPPDELTGSPEETDSAAEKNGEPEVIAAETGDKKETGSESTGSGSETSLENESAVTGNEADTAAESSAQSYPADESGEEQMLTGSADPEEIPGDKSDSIGENPTEQTGEEQSFPLQNESESGEPESEQLSEETASEQNSGETEEELIKEEPAESHTETEELTAESAAEQTAEAPEAENTSEEPEIENTVKEPASEQNAEEPAAEDPAVEEPEVEEPAGISLQEYRQLYKDMMEVADEPEHSLVQVIGITSEMDYFNQNYENQQRISGLAIAMTDTDLFILTEYRVVDRVERIQVVFYDGSMTDATFQKADQNTGLAVIKVPLDNISKETRKELITAPLGNSYKVERGEPVMALGSPLGFADSIAYGIVTSTGSKVSAADTEYALLTTDIEGSADGSGVLIDLDGKIVGIITRNFESSTDCITGLAISQLKGLIEDLSNNESRNYVGIYGQDVTQDITDRTGIPKGLLVTGVEQDSPAMLAGIKEYDVIVRIRNQAVDSMRGYRKALEGLESEEPVIFTAMRRGTEGYAEIKFEVTVESR